MKKWYLSENGEVNGPFSIDDVKTLVLKNNELYGWNPSFSHWLPAVKIREFRTFLPEDKVSHQVSKDLIDKFVSKKKDLNKKVDLIDDSIQRTLKSMLTFEHEIADYKDLTVNLNAEVKDNILPLERKYNSVKRHLSDLQKAAEIAKKEIEDVVKEFGELVVNKSTDNSKDLFDSYDESNDSDKQKVAEADVLPISAQPAAQPVKSVVKNISEDPVVVKSSPSVVSKKYQTAIPAAAAVTSHPFDQRGQTANKPETITSSISNTQSDSQSNTQSIGAEKKGFSNKLKSVFGSNKTQDNVPDSMSEQLMQLEKEVIEEDEDIVIIDSDSSSNAEDLKKKTRRRRRF